MILQIGAFILLCVVAYVIYVCVPEIKEWLKKIHTNTYNTNITLPNIQGIQIPQGNTETSNVKKEEEEEIPLERLEEKMRDIFVNPDIRDIKTNFSELGNIKVEKKRKEKKDE